LEGETIKKLRIDNSKRPTKQRWLTCLLVIIFLILLAMILALLKKKPTTVEVIKVSQKSDGESLVLLNASGYVTPRTKATVASKITGRVKEILVDEGSYVKKGQLIALLDESDFKAILAKAISAKEVVEASLTGTKAKLEEAEKNLKRGEELFKDGFLDEQSLDRLKADLVYLKSQYESNLKGIEEAEAAIKVAQQDIENCKVVAPFNGVVISKDAQPGEMVSPFSAGGGFTRTGIVTIVDMGSLEIEVDVSESNLSKVYQNQNVSAVLDAYPEIKFSGRVRTVIPSADRQKATVKVRISFDKLDPKILPDMGVRVSFLEESKNRKGVFIPRSCVFEKGDKHFIFVFENGKIIEREIETGEKTEDSFQIFSGLSEGELVVVNSNENLKNGIKAKAVNME